MQSVFFRILQEHSSGNIRTVVESALSQIIEFHLKPDSIIIELNKIIDNSVENVDELYILILKLKFFFFILGNRYLIFYNQKLIINAYWLNLIIIFKNFNCLFKNNSYLIIFCLRF